jgi:hypothetical protein
MIDQATNGIVAVTLPAVGTTGSPNDIDITNGAVSDGRNRFIELVDGGDLGGTAYVRITPNDAEKIVHVRNSLSGSQDILIFQGTYNASNDFLIPNGADVVLKFDGGGTGATVTDCFVLLTPTGLSATNITGTNITGTNWTGLPTADLTTAGIIEIATVAETSPDGLDGWTGSAQVTTLGTIATGTWQGTAIGASYLPTADLTTAGIIEIATGAETNTGTDATRAVSPDGLDDWTGSAQITTLGTIATGTWQGTAIGASYLPTADLTTSGIIEIATGAETNTGTDATRAVSPDGLNDWTGSAQITTLGTIGTGTWQGSVIAEAYLPNASTTAEGVVERATQAEVDAGTDTSRYVTPETLAAYTGFTSAVETFTAGVTVAERDLCYLNTSGQMVLADADAVSTGTGLLAVANEAISATSSGEFLMFGRKTGFTGLTAGDVLYIHTTAGDFTGTAPSGTGDIVRVAGYALSTTEIYFQPAGTWVEIA